MASKGRKISPTEWEHHKTTIVELYFRHPLHKLIEVMLEQHGFTASRSQYEAQLRAWGVRKNAKLGEWESLFHQNENTELVGDIEVFPGRLKSQSTVRRARRYVKFQNKLRAGLQQDHENALVTDSAANDQQSISQCTGPDRGESSIPIINFSPPLLNMEYTPDQFSLDHSSELGPSVLESRIGNIGTSQLAPTGNFGIRNCFGDIYLSGNPIFHNALSPTQWNGFVTTGPVQEEFLDIGSFNGAGSDQFLGSSNWNFVPSSEVLAQWLSALPFNDLERSFGSKKITMTLALRQRCFVSTLNSLLPGEPPIGSQSVLSREDMLETNVTRTLLFSVLNNFAGMDAIPIPLVLEFLGHTGYASSFLLQILKGTTNHIARSFAENLFCAAIEAGNTTAVSLLLGSHLVNPNTAVCDVGGKKFTAVERSAALEHFDLVRVLILANVDVNKTFAREPFEKAVHFRDPVYGGALERLIEAATYDNVFPRPPPVRASQDLLDTVDCLLLNGAKVHLTDVQRTCSRFTNTELSYRLLRSIPASDHVKAISEGLLSMAALELDDAQAVEVIRGILQACDTSECRKCADRLAEDLDWALVAGARRGHKGVIKLLYPHVQYPSNVLAAAIRSGRSKVIDFVLAQRPKLDAPARYIEVEKIKRYSQLWSMQPIESIDYTSPLAEAIRLGDARLIREIEAAGALESINSNTSQLGPVLAAASQTGNMSYLRKILSLDLPLRGSVGANALQCALEEDHRDVAWALLDAGVDTVSNNERSQPLELALQTRDFPLVRAVLNSGTIPVTAGVLLEAVKCGDEQVISDLAQFDLYGINMDSVYKHCRSAETLNLFRIIVESCRFDKYQLRMFLRAAVDSDDSEMVQYLVETGADGNELLALAIRDHPQIARLLLRLSGRILPRYSRFDLEAAIEAYPTDPESLNIILQTGAVDLNGRIDYHRQQYLYPLAVAIETIQKNSSADLTLITRLLAAGCNPDKIAKYTVVERDLLVVYICERMKTALLLAIESRRKDVVQVLLDHRVHINKEATLGITRTPLQCAAELGSLDIVKLLLGNGANVNSQPADRDGGTALQFAAISGNCNVAAELLKAGALLHAPPSKVRGRWPLEGAAEHGRIDMIKFLWNASVTGFEETICRKAMSLAEQNGHIGCKNFIKDLWDDSKVAFNSSSQT